MRVLRVELNIFWPYASVFTNKLYALIDSLLLKLYLLIGTVLNFLLIIQPLYFLMWIFTDSKGFEPLHVFTRLTVFKTAPFNQTWVTIQNIINQIIQFS